MHPIFLERIHKILSPEALEHFGKKPGISHFRINTLKTSVPKIYEQLKSLNIPFEPVAEYGYAIGVPLQEAQQVLSSPLVAQGELYPQGLESMQSVIELDPKPGENVLDLCAAPGSKTSQIASHMNNEGTLVANEPIRDRFYRLKSVLNLTGSKATLTMVDGRRYQVKDKPFDRVLVDAPCSSEGRFRYDQPKSYAYWSVRKIKEMSHKQKGLLLNASRLLASGGTLVYSTCTFAPEENEEVIEWFARKSEGMTLQLQKRLVPDGRMEGFFIAKWQKV